MQGDDLQKLLDAVSRDGQELRVLREKPVQRDPNGNAKKPKLDENEPHAEEPLEAFPGAGKTTVTAAADEFLCLVSDGKVKILVIAGQHAAVDALNGNLTKRLQSSVPGLNKRFGKRSDTDSSSQPV